MSALLRRRRMILQYTRYHSTSSSLVPVVVVLLVRFVMMSSTYGYLTMSSVSDVTLLLYTYTRRAVPGADTTVIVDFLDTHIDYTYTTYETYFTEPAHICITGTLCIR